LEASEFIYYLGNSHIYDDHIEDLKLQIERVPNVLPTIEITNHHEKIEDYSLDDIKLYNYTSHASIKMEMRT